MPSIASSTQGFSMAGAVHRPLLSDGARNRLWWLPEGGYDNGLDDDAWAPVLEVEPRVLMPLLNLLRAADVPAYAAPADTVAHRLRRRDPAVTLYRLWVGSSAYGKAEAALIVIMPLLNGDEATLQLAIRTLAGSTCVAPPPS